MNDIVNRTKDFETETNKMLKEYKKMTSELD